MNLRVHSGATVIERDTYTFLVKNRFVANVFFNNSFVINYSPSMSFLIVISNFKFFVYVVFVDALTQLLSRKDEVLSVYTLHPSCTM